MKVAFAITLIAGLPVALASAILKPRIIGPDEPTNRFKFVVSIQENTKEHYCGGMLLDSTTVLTASHCFLNITDAGIDDIGTIKLATPIEKSNGIDYARRPTSDAVLDRSEELVAVGWGRNITVAPDQAAFTVPKRAEALLEQQPFDKCRNPDHAGDVSTLICAGKPGKTVCSGDSGGPLVDLKTGTVVGLVSFTEPDEFKVLCTKAGIFTRVGSYLDFINENLGQQGFTDGDNQRIKDEAKRPALLEACKARHFDSLKACMTVANDAFNSNGKPQATPEEWAAYRQEVAICDAFQGLGFACNACAEKATVDSTNETVIQCSEAAKKGD